MADNKRLFGFNARIVKSGAADMLEVDVMNDSSTEAWAGPLLIEFKLPAEMVAPPLREASLKARTNEEPRNMAPLNDAVTAAEGWSVWAINEPNDHVVVVRVFNNIDQQTGAKAETTTEFAAGATLTLRVPLAPEALSTQFTLRYGYQTGRGKDTRVDGSLDFTPSHLGEWKPQVSLTADHRNPTMIDPGAYVKISWSVKGGISATLRGPLAGGNSELTLSRDKNSNYKMEEGSLTIIAVGPATYVLDAEVQGPEGQPNVQVVRTLTIDIYASDKYANLRVRPGNVLPNGQIEIDWAVWGVKKAAIKIGNRLKLGLELTEQNLSRYYQGTGIWRVHARDNQATETIRLYILTEIPEAEDEFEEELWKDTIIEATPWEKFVDKPVFTGKALALAVADGHMALLTRDGFYTAPVGKSDADLKDPVFTRSQAQGKAWHALAAFGRDFVVLRQTDGDDIVLERYDAKGLRIKLPVTLPGDFQTLARRNGAVFDLVGYGNRVYVVVEAPASGRWARSAYSVRLDPDEHVRPEGLLASLEHFHLLTFDGKLYAFQRGTGRMLRFGLTSAGELAPPTKAASAVNAEGRSMIKTGLLVPIGTVLAVLDPAALPSLDPSALAVFGLLNVADFAVKALTPTRKANEIPQDLVYNPKKDRWAACGHGLKIQPGAIATYRGGASERLWVLQPDGEMYKLAGASEKLFAPDFVSTFPSKDLPPVHDAVRQFTLTNMSVYNLVPVDEVCRAAGVEGLSTDGFAELTPSPNSASTPSYRSNSFRLSYNSTDTTSATVRFMVANPSGTRYLFEMNFSGPGLGSVNTVYKRLTTSGRLDVVPETLKTYPANEQTIVVASSRLLNATTRLFIINSTPEELRLTPTVASDKVQDSLDIDVSYNTPDFKISLPNAEKSGHVWVTFDYTKPMGVEMAPRNQVQQSLIRISTSESRMLEATPQQLNKFFTTAVRFDRYDGSKFGITPQPNDVYSCQVRLKSKMELDGVRLGDAALNPDRSAIFLALANPDNVSQVRVVRVDLGSLDSTEKTYETKGNIFSVPNAITVSEMYYDVMFAENVRYTAAHNFGTPWPQTIEGYEEIVALKSSRSRNVFKVGKKLRRVGYERMPGYFLTVAYLGNTTEETPLDNIAFPVSVPPLAVSDDGRTAAMADQGGLLLIDMRVAVNARKAQSVRIPNTRGPAHVVFSNDGSWVYCAHVTRVMSGGGPRRAVAGRDITVSRVNVGQLTMQTLALPNVEGSFALTGNTRQSFSSSTTYKEEVALSLAVSPDDKNLFVSAGTSIMKIALDTFTLHPWRASVELPCRLVGVTKAGANAYTVYALGSSYVGDGTKVDEYKTHLYAVAAPAS